MPASNDGSPDGPQISRMNILSTSSTGELDIRLLKSFHGNSYGDDEGFCRPRSGFSSSEGYGGNLNDSKASGDEGSSSSLKDCTVGSFESNRGASLAKWRNDKAKILESGRRALFSARSDSSLSLDRSKGSEISLELNRLDPSLTLEDFQVQYVLSRAIKHGDFSLILAFVTDKGTSTKHQGSILSGVRAMAKANKEPATRLRIGEKLGLDFLISFLEYEDERTVEHATTILFYLSLVDKFKNPLCTYFAVESLSRVIRRKIAVASQNAAATICVLANVDERRFAVGLVKSVIPALLSFLQITTRKGLKDAVLALLSLSLYPGNRREITRQGGVPCLFQILRREDNDEKLEEKIMALLFELSKEVDARAEMADEDSISALVETLDSCSEACKINTIDTLLNLVELGPGVEILILSEGPLPQLQRMSLSGSESLKSRALKLYGVLKERLNCPPSAS